MMKSGGEGIRGAVSPTETKGQVTCVERERIETNSSTKPWNTRVSLQVLTGWLWASPVLSQCLPSSKWWCVRASCSQLSVYITFWETEKSSNAYKKLGVESWSTFANQCFGWVMPHKGKAWFGASLWEPIPLCLEVPTSEGQLGHGSWCSLDLNFAELQARCLRGISALQLTSLRAQVCWPMGHGISFFYVVGCENNRERTVWLFCFLLRQTELHLFMLRSVTNALMQVGYVRFCLWKILREKKKKQCPASEFHIRQSQIIKEPAHLLCFSVWLLSFWCLVYCYWS